jgi:xanthine dehydrogenase YagS FAD-binding subunit
VKTFAYHSPRTIADVADLLSRTADQDGAKPLAGGTDLLTLMKADLLAPERLVDIKRLAELDHRIAEDAAGLTIGALTTLAQLEETPLVRTRYPALAEAAALAATPQLRNMATIGGNLLQRPRCWYFRNPRVHCWLKGGAECQARQGENQLHALFDVSPCVAVHPSDPATALVALDASVRLRGPDGERDVPLTEFFAPPTDSRRAETIIAPDELIVSIHIPQASAGPSVYLKAMERKVWAFALVSVAAQIRLEEGRIEFARIVLGGVAPLPWRATAAERILTGAAPDEARIAHAADAALEGAQPLAHNGYKIPLTKTLVRRALDQTLASALVS